MSVIKLTEKIINRDLDRVLFEDGKHLGDLRERYGYRPDIKSLTDREWYYLIYTAREAYILGAKRVEKELNRRAEAEVREAQRKAEDKIYRDLEELMRN